MSEVTGKIIQMSPAKKVSASFTKQEFVMEVISDNPKYPQYVQFEASGKAIEFLGKFKVGDAISVDYNLRGRAWEAPTGEVKYFNTLSVWKVNAAEAATEAGDDPWASIPA